jgi:hypothetical protein
MSLKITLNKGENLFENQKKDFENEHLESLEESYE